MSEDVVHRLSGVRGMVARRMVGSLQEAAQLTFHASLDASALLAEAEQATQKPLELQDGTPVKVSVEDVLCYQFVQHLLRNPLFNATIADKEVVVAVDVNLGVAISAHDTLLVPVIPQANALTLEQVATARRALVKAAVEESLTADQMRGATVTISNLGRGRTEQFTPILNPGQVALLGVAGLGPKPWVVEGVIEVRPVLHLSLTVDHRWIDGLPANRFLSEFCEMCEGL